MTIGNRRRVAIACQGGGSHAAFAAGALIELFQTQNAAKYELIALSGTSGGAVCAALAWSGLIRLDGGPETAADTLSAFWEELSADDPVDSIVNAWSVFWARFPVSWEVSPYLLPESAAARLRSMLRKHVRLEELPPDAEVRRRPALLIGATDIRSGEGVAFRGETLSYDDIIASAAVPPLYRAVHAHGTLYWDGLFSRNPPIREFTDFGPDQIWVIRINPRRREREPILIQEILDRRNELSGNLSLDQEIFFIRKINELVEAYPALRDRYRRIEIREIELSLDLDYPSKLDRNPWLIRDLIETGRKAAPHFLVDGGEARLVVEPPLQDTAA
jgi:NTE family protein